MASESRTAKSIQNVKVALLFYILNLVLQFFSRKIFLDYLGSEVLGLNTTAQKLIKFLKPCRAWNRDSSGIQPIQTFI